MKKQIEKSRLDLSKFQISKLSNPSIVTGGNGVYDDDDDQSGQNTQTRGNIQ